MNNIQFLSQYGDQKATLYRIGHSFPTDASLYITLVFIDDEANEYYVRWIDHHFKEFEVDKEYLVVDLNPYAALNFDREAFYMRDEVVEIEDYRIDR
jgi:hypothetical protein